MKKEMQSILADISSFKPDAVLCASKGVASPESNCSRF